MPTKAAQRRSSAQRVAKSRANRAAGAMPQVPVYHIILAADKERLDRLARHWGTLKSNALMGALRLAETQVASGLDGEARARYFADTAQQLN